MDLGHVDVVLVRPARARNVAAACRALKNMGLSSLTLVDAPAELATPEVRGIAYGAWDLLDAARRAASLTEAVKECRFVAGTTGRPVAGAWTPRRLAQDAEARAGIGRLAVVFGPEATGLTRGELNLCHERVHIPANPAHSSLNLAQAVLVVAYELRLAADTAAEPAPEPMATHAELEQALEELAQGLLGIGYLNQQQPEGVLTELRRLIARAAPSRRELTLLRGLARQVRWAASRIASPGGREG